MAYYHFKSAGFSATKTLHKSFSSERTLILPFPPLEYRAQNLSIPVFSNKLWIKYAVSSRPEKQTKTLAVFKHSIFKRLVKTLQNAKFSRHTHLFNYWPWFKLVNAHQTVQIFWVELAKDAVKVSRHSIAISHKTFSRRLQASKQFEGLILILNVLYPVKNQI